MVRTHDRIRRSFVEAASASPAAAAAETAATRGSSAPEPTPAAPESSARGRSHGFVGVPVVGPVCVSLFGERERVAKVPGRREACERARRCARRTPGEGKRATDVFASEEG